MSTMCLIALALHVSSEFPLVIAANRDEDYERPSLRAHVWTDAPQVMGGRDVTHGGSWLAISANGRFAAVTNLRGVGREGRSRGLLVRDFVLGLPAPANPTYAGFNLVSGTVDGPVHLASNADDSTIEWTAGVHGVSNAGPGVAWPKVAKAVEQMSEAVANLRSREELVEALLRFLRTPGTKNAESDVFVAGDRHGTRSSTVVLASTEKIWMFEQNYGRWGRPDGPTIALHLDRRS